jgi:hypothetical protein
MQNIMEIMKTDIRKSALEITAIVKYIRILQDTIQQVSFTATFFKCKCILSQYLQYSVFPLYTMISISINITLVRQP